MLHRQGNSSKRAPTRSTHKQESIRATLRSACVTDRRASALGSLSVNFDMKSHAASSTPPLPSPSSPPPRSSCLPFLLFLSLQSALRIPVQYKKGFGGVRSVQRQNNPWLEDFFFYFKFLTGHLLQKGTLHKTAIWSVKKPSAGSCYCSLVFRLYGELHVKKA